MALILSGDTGVPSSGMPAGSVIQTVQGTLTTAFSTTSTSFVDIGLAASITPISTSNKILAIVNLNGVHSSDTSYNVYFTLVRNSTNLTSVSLSGGWGIRTGQTNGRWGSDSISYLDSPSTTSATTYKIQLASEGGGRTAYVSDVNSFNALSTITLMEIKV
jgi:hypothetical protein